MSGLRKALGARLRQPRVLIGALLLALIAAGLVLGPEIAALAKIAFGRGTDKVELLVLPAVFERSYEDVVKTNTEQAQEIESYLDRLRTPANRTDEALGLDFASEEAFLRSTSKLRSLLAASLSYPPPGLLTVPASSAMTRLREDQFATYYDVSVPVLEGVHARGLFMMPASHSGKVPLVIVAHGRGGLPSRPKGGKLPVITRSNRDLAYGALQRGYAVWQPVFVFYSAAQPPDIRDRLEARARESGTTLPAIEIAKIVRSLDALVALENVDATRIAMVGISYGGFYTLYTAALDERIGVAVVAAYFNDRQAILDSTEPSGNLDWRFPRSLSVFQDPTLAALICPRALQIQAGDHDQLFPISGARKTVPAARAVYERMNVGARFSFIDFAGRHDFKRKSRVALCPAGLRRPAAPIRREQAVTV